jgi:hypothetical protein
MSTSDPETGAATSWREPRNNTLFLVSCVSKKRSTPAPARDLYSSEWFVKANAEII